jgi:hypothetical protein
VPPTPTVTVYGVLALTENPVAVLYPPPPPPPPAPEPPPPPPATTRYSTVDVGVGGAAIAKPPLKFTPEKTMSAIIYYPLFIKKLYI